MRINPVPSRAAATAKAGAFALLLAATVAPAANAQVVNDNAVGMHLRIVTFTGSGGAASPFVRSTATVAPNSVLSTDGTVTARTRRFAVEYQLYGAPSDGDVYSGVAASFLDIGAFTNGTLGPTTVTYPSPITARENVASAAPPLPSDGTTVQTRTGIVSPFRGGFANANNNADPSNGSASGVSIINVLPLTLTNDNQAQPGYDDFSGNPAFPLVGNEWYRLYVFSVTFDQTASGLFTLTVDTIPDPVTGNRFGFFLTQQNAPVGSTTATAGQIQLNVNAYQTGCCLAAGGCAVLMPSVCTAQGGVVGPAGSDCSVPLCCVAPGFASQPQSQSLIAGQPVTFSAPTTGTGPFAYQWYLNAMPLIDGPRISGSHTQTLMISSVIGSDAGMYTLQATSQCGVVITSNPANLSVCSPPTGSIGANPPIPYEGQVVTLTATASGAGPFSYQWRRRGVAIGANCRISGTQSNVLQFNPIQLTDADTYDCLVTGACGTGAANPISLAVTPCAPPITLQPVTVQARVTQPATFTVQVAGPGTFMYQWRREGVNLVDGGRIAGATTPTLTVNYVSRTDGGVIDVIVSGACGSTRSAGAALLPFTCTADANWSGTVTVQDIFDFLSAWFSGCP